MNYSPYGCVWSLLLVKLEYGVSLTDNNFVIFILWHSFNCNDGVSVHLDSDLQITNSVDRRTVHFL